MTERTLSGRLPIDATGVLGLALLVSCSAPAPPPSESPPERPIESYLLTRISYRTSSGWKDLPVRRSVRSLASAAQIDELQAATRRLIERTPGGAGSPPPGRAVRRYELRALGEHRPPIDLDELPAPLPTRVTVDLGGTRAHGLLRTWKAPLFRAGVEALEEALEPPRTPRAWQLAALAACLEPTSPLPAATHRRILDRVLSAVVDLDDPNAQRQLCTALLPAVPSLDEEALRTLVARDGRTPARVLLLTHRAANGERHALEEILTVALEYGGPPSIFARAMVVCFPPESNQRLYASFSIETVEKRQAIPFLQFLREHLDQAGFLPSGGWRLGRA